MKVIVVCHTEYGFIRNGRMISQKKARQGTALGVKNLNKIAGKHGARITYAVCPEVVDDFPVEPGHEIGIHIHPGWEKASHDNLTWYVGDRYLKENCTQSNYSSVLKDHPYSEQYEMIKIGRELIEEKLGVRPRSFVAGRWSINNDTTRALVENGITHECSASPSMKMAHFDWSGLPRICMPYNPSSSDYQDKGDMPLLMVPISQFYPSGNVNPEAAPTVGASWLRACFSEYHKQGLPLFHICVHSPSMTDKYYMKVMDQLLNFISRHSNIEFDVASNNEKSGPLDSHTVIPPYLKAINPKVMKAYFKTRKDRAARSSGK